jgi:hypothetical protein
MAKVDKSQYTKEEWLAIKAERREAKSAKHVSQLPQDYYILCLKHGTKYSSEYVNKLYNMIKRNCTLDYKFACLTDDPMDLNPDIQILNLPKGLPGWWNKPYMFSKDLPIKGTILYLDLDVVISSNVDKLLTWQPNHWCIVKDYTRAMRPGYKKYNSSVVKFKTGELDFVWETYKKDPVKYQKLFFGDQDYLYDITYKTKAAMLYPDSWTQSWKWEVRATKDFKPGGIRGQREFKDIESVVPRIECCVCVFHGDPNPEHCHDPWVIENWQ